MVVTHCFITVLPIFIMNGTNDAGPNGQWLYCTRR